MVRVDIKAGGVMRSKLQLHAVNNFHDRVVLFLQHGPAELRLVELTRQKEERRVGLLFLWPGIAQQGHLSKDTVPDQTGGVSVHSETLQRVSMRERDQRFLAGF